MRTLTNWAARRSGRNITIEGDEDGVRAKIVGIDSIYSTTDGRVIARVAGEQQFLLAMPTRP